MEKDLPDKNYIVRRLGTNKTQLLHRISLRKFTQAPLAVIFVPETDWQKDDQMIVAHDELYAQSWNTNFGPTPFEDGPLESSRNDEETQYFPIQIPENDHPSFFDFPKNSGGCPVEQTTVPEETNRDVTPQEIVDDVSITNETQKERSRTDKKSRKKPRKNPGNHRNSQNTLLQEELINTRGEKYNLRPNRNQNYSDSHRY